MSVNGEKKNNKRETCLVQVRAANQKTKQPTAARLTGPKRTSRHVREEKRQKKHKKQRSRNDDAAAERAREKCAKHKSGEGGVKTQLEAKKTKRWVSASSSCGDGADEESKEHEKQREREGEQNAA